MLAIDYFGGKKRIINNIEEERGKIGTQSRVYDYNTGIYARILPNSEGKYSFAESGIGANGVFYNIYSFCEVLDCDKREANRLMRIIKSNIDELGSLSSNAVNYIIQYGFLEFLGESNMELSYDKNFQTLLRTEKILNQFDNDGKIGYNEVLQQINEKLNSGNLPEGDRDRKILEQLKHVYENEMFRLQRESDELIKNEQKARNEEHTAQEISEDLQDIGRDGVKEEALKNIIEFKETEIDMSAYGFNEDGLMLGEYTIEQVQALYEKFKDEFDLNGLPINEEYLGTELGEIISNYTRYLKDTLEMKNERDGI